MINKYHDITLTCIIQFIGSHYILYTNITINKILLPPLHPMKPSFMKKLQGKKAISYLLLINYW